MRRITYRKAAAVAMAAALSAALLVGCGSTAASTDSAAASTVADESAAESTAEDADLFGVFVPAWGATSAPYSKAAYSVRSGFTAGSATVTAVLSSCIRSK